LQFPHAGSWITVVGLVALMNVVNFSDGVDGLAAGVCAIIAGAMAVIAFDLGREQPGVLAAITAGAALGFLVFNFPPASSFMGDSGSNLLGLLMGVVIVEAAVKTAAVVSFVLPLILLAVPFLDTTFVVLKRVKYKQPVYRPDSEHFHHRMARIGFSRRGTIGFFYAWTLMLAGVALGVLAIAASIYLVYVLEILKFRRLSEMRLRRLSPELSPAEIEAGIAQDFETGEFQAVAEAGKRHPGGDGGVGPRVTRTQQRVGQRQVDQDGVGADNERGGQQAPITADGG
jgi:UDP-GlcNAc:undecaprenyl-phosphate GlcNAc-1-phosphate transferase